MSSIGFYNEFNSKLYKFTNVLQKLIAAILIFLSNKVSLVAVLLKEECKDIVAFDERVEAADNVFVTISGCSH